jgi:two-component sensor histidine kinase
VLPKATAIINFEVEHDFPGLGRRTMLLTARTLSHPDNNSHSLLLAFVDATDSKRRNAAKDMLFGELRHRMKNVLGVAQSIARQTPTEGLTAEQFRDVFLGRFGALVDAQDLAFSEQENVGLSELVERILAPYTADPKAVVIDASSAPVLNPRTIMSLGLILHELATNAAKHGALSVPGGRVQVSYHLEEPDQSLRISWVESGGPIVTEPATTGFGTRLLRHTATYSLHGKLEQDYAKSGLHVELVVPLKGPS